ncbi:helix-turn-helix domain-containing protein [Diaphorobacter ruginosibacter]|jgi:IclR family pca regulon transcriptional regulator|uniref:Helix-turn-helix domain-containing protein n=1 Tax=Diaphorobacter ruginosibacter TaxID=1715720 RepID=A0A7G9RLX3_9BURK|nr:IclR family transcriptional regulator C-terminal domain-containing protein [Diaphorobacter ruginosibacter]MDR2335813.1 helix-turn-helix domain-containing protein [Burkholderiaceae bacterium]QNN56598.1 helix-turn-helix domain-containing protein [Diaphorobacter ruginosibacter]
MTTPQPGDTYVQSFARGLEVIRSFSANAPEQTLSEVAAQTGLTRAGARRILLTLQTLGYVQSDDRYFRLTPKILDLGFAYLTSMPMWDLAEPLMDQLVEKVHESCSTAVLDDLDIVYVLRVHTHKIMSTNLSVGSRLPAFWTSLGRVLLAGLPEDELRERLARLPRRQYTQYTAVDDDVLLERIREAREQGWCLLNQELEEGLSSIAAPIKDRAGHTIAALNISGHSNRTSVDKLKNELLPQLLQASQAISRLMVTRRR